MRLTDAYFEITNLCNLNCATCYNRSGLNQTHYELSYSTLTAIFERLASDFECRSFSLAGGEPLLHTEADKLFDYIRSHPEYRFNFVTNGTVHKESFFSMILSDPSRFHVQVSLDGSTEEINARTRGKGAFHRTMQFIDRLSCDFFHPMIKMVISQKNLDDIEPFFLLAVSHGCLPVFDFVTRSGNASDDWDDMGLSPSQKIQALKQISLLNQKYPDYAAALPLSGGTCPLSDPSMATSALIKTDGTMFPCQLLYDNDYSCGNIITDSTDTVVAGIRRIQNMVISRKSRDYNCQRCPLRGKCAHGCIAQAICNCGDPVANDGNCPLRRLEFINFELIPQLPPSSQN